MSDPISQFNPPEVTKVTSLVSPYHSLPDDQKVRVQAMISSEAHMQLKSYFPRKGVLDAVIGGLLNGFLQHVESLDLHSTPREFYHNEQIYLSLIQSYTPDNANSEIQYTLNEHRIPHANLRAVKVPRAA